MLGFDLTNVQPPESEGYHEPANGGGATKTRIMYKAFLSYAQLKEYLTVLLENNLLEYQEGAYFLGQRRRGYVFYRCITNSTK
jgi:predicted transcriptional regulator